MKYIVLLFLLLCSCGYKTKSTSTVMAFPETGVLKAHIKKLDNPILLPRAMCVANDYLFIYKEKEEMLFDIFHVPDNRYLGSSGRRGQGPEDFRLLDPRSFHVSDKGFNVMEAGSNLLKTVTFEGDHLSVLQVEKMLMDYGSNNGFYPLKDSIYLTLGSIDGGKEYGLYDKKKEKYMEIGSYPIWTSENIEQDQLFLFYIKHCIVHPQGEKFAAFYSRFKRFRIHESSSGNLLYDIDVQIDPYKSKIENRRAVSQYYICQPMAIGNYIYVLCANAEDLHPELPNGCELQVWDWKGNPIACYSFDRKISLITFSEKYNQLFALDMSIDNELYIYNIPELKKQVK